MRVFKANLNASSQGRRMRSAVWAALAAGVLAAATTRAADPETPAQVTLRGVLVAPGTNASADVVAVLQSPRQMRKPCPLRAADAEVATRMRELIASGVVVQVTGMPGAEAFTVCAFGRDGRPRKKPAAAEDPPGGSMLPAIHWGAVPADTR